MPDMLISTITLPNGLQYEIKDARARELIAAMGDVASWIGVTTTALTDGATTNPITISGESVTAKTGNVVSYGELEFIFNGTKWQEFGSTGALKALAFKNSASGSYTPSGSVSKPAIDVTPTTGTVATVSDVGTLPELTAVVANENLTLSFSQGTLPTVGGSQTVLTGITAELHEAPSFTGTAATITVE